MDAPNTPHLLTRQSKRAQTDGPLPTSDWQKTGVPIIIGLVYVSLPSLLFTSSILPS